MNEKSPLAWLMTLFVILLAASLAYILDGDKARYSLPAERHSDTDDSIVYGTGYLS